MGHLIPRVPVLVVVGNRPPRQPWTADPPVEPLIPQRNSDHGSGLGIFRWVVERTIGWLHQFRRLRIRYERRADIHTAFLLLGCILICHRHLKSSLC